MSLKREAGAEGQENKVNFNIIYMCVYIYIYIYTQNFTYT